MTQIDLFNGSWIIGDCLEKMKNIPDNSIDMILCDLPYGTTKNEWDNIIPFAEMWDQYKRIIKLNKAIVLCGQEPFSSKLRLSNLEWYKYDWYWKKSRPHSYVNAKLKPLKDIEIISVFSEGKTANGSKNNMIYNPQRIPRTKDQISPSRTEPKFPRQVLEFSNSNRQQIHPTQKPIPLFEYLIKTYSDEGNLILDNCAGSGTTAIACEDLNRKWICIEQDEEYSNQAIERILQHKGK